MTDRRQLGKLPARTDSRTLRLVNYLHWDSLPTPPANTNRIPGPLAGVTWPMYLNDQLGDCTIAGAAHMQQAWARLAGKPDPKITDAQVLTAYEIVSGYNPSTGQGDNGAVELDVLNRWRRNGIAGHKIDAYAAIQHRVRTEVHLANWLFDGLYLGVALPLTAQNQTTWHCVPFSGARGRPGSWGGHCVPVVDTDSRGLTVITWGAPKRMSWPFFAKYCDEAYAAISVDALTAKGVTREGFALNALHADLTAATS